MTAPRSTDTVIRAFLDEGITELPDRAFDAVRGDIHRTRQRVVVGPWKEPSLSGLARLAVAAAIVLVVGATAWANLGPGNPGFGGTLPTPIPVPTLPSQGGDVPSGTWRIPWGAAPGVAPGTESDHRPSLVVTVPAGWTSFSGFTLDKNYGPTDADAGPSLALWAITNTFRNPCTDHQLAQPSPGPGVDALVSALAALPGVTAAAPRDVTIDGYRGKSIDLTVTTNLDTCADGFWTWGDPGGYREAQVNGELDRVYVLDVDGQRRTFFLRIPTRTTPADRAELQTIVDSIDIQP
jgi:hypothetical protein